MRRLIVLNILRQRQYTISSMNSKFSKGRHFALEKLPLEYTKKTTLFSKKHIFILSTEPPKSISDNITSFIQRRAILISYFRGSIFAGATPDPHALTFYFSASYYIFFVDFLLLYALFISSRCRSNRA